MDIVMPRCLDCPFDLRLWPAVRTHRVQGYDAWHEVAALAGFLDVQNFAAFVVAAFGTRAVRHLALVTVWALRECMALERIMSAPISGACFRVSPFWIWHLNSFLCRRERPRSCAFSLNQNQSSSLLRRSFRAVQRGSSTGSAQEHCSRFRFAPQCGQSPLQSSRQMTFNGTANSTCSRTASSSSKPSP